MSLKPKKLGQTISLYFKNLKYDDKTPITDPALGFIFTVVERNSQQTPILRVESDDLNGMTVGLVDEVVAVLVVFNTDPEDGWEVDTTYDFELWCIDPAKGPPGETGRIPLQEDDFTLEARDTGELAIT